MINQGHCGVCGKLIWNGNYCNKCNKEIVEMERKQLHREHRFIMRFEKAEFEMIDDMIHVDAGGFEKGAKFTRDDMVEMLKNKVLARGTTVKYIPTGELYHVEYGYESAS